MKKTVIAAIALLAVLAGATLTAFYLTDTSISPSPSPSPSYYPTPTPSPSYSPSPTPSNSTTPTPSPSVTPTPTPTQSPSPTPTPIITPTPTPTPKNLTDRILDQSYLARDIFNSDKGAWDNVVKVATVNGSDIPKNLAYQVLKQYEGDGRIADKLSSAKEAFKLYSDRAGSIQRLSQIYGLDNATDYFKTAAAMRSELGNDTITTILDKLGQNDGINVDFNASRVHANMFRLAKYASNIVNYPKDWREGAIQVDKMVYTACNVNPATDNETDVWASAVGPAVKYMVDKLDSGEAKYDLGIPDTALDAQMRRQRMLPLELFTINITSGAQSLPSINIAKYNVSPNPSLGGKAPQQWLEDLAKADIAGNTPRYQLAMTRTRITSYPEVYWPKSNETFQNSLDTVLADDKTAVFIIGYSRALASEYIPWNLKPAVPMKGQITPYYASLIARALGRASFVVSDVYPPTGAPGAHCEPYVAISSELYNKLKQKGELLLPNMFGGWPYKAALKADHDNKDLGVRTYNPGIMWADGTEEEIKLD